MNKLLFGAVVTLLSSVFIFDVVASTESKQQRNKRPKPPSFATLDENQDGEITLEEFIQKRPPKHTPEEIFSHIDADSNGVVTLAEFDAHKPPKKKRRGQGKDDSRGAPESH